MNPQNDARWASVVDTVRAALRQELRLAEGTPLPEKAELDLLQGADSIRLMRTVADLERRYGLEFDDDALRSAETIADLARLVINTQVEVRAQP